MLVNHRKTFKTFFQDFSRLINKIQGHFRTAKKIQDFPGCGNLVNKCDASKLTFLSKFISKAFSMILLYKFGKKSPSTINFKPQTRNGNRIAPKCFFQKNQIKTWKKSNPLSHIKIKQKNQRFFRLSSNFFQPRGSLLLAIC